MAKEGKARVLNEAEFKRLLIIAKDSSFALRNTAIIFCPPYQFHKFIESGKKNIGYTMWETDKLHPFFIKNLELLDDIMVPSHRDKEVFSKYFNNTHLVTLPYENNFNLTKEGDRKVVKFYSIFEWTDRKSPSDLISSFGLEFNADDNVEFILKTSGNLNDIHSQINSIINL